MSDCKHLNRAYEFTIMKKLPATQRWICRDCGYQGLKVIRVLPGDHDFESIEKKFLEGGKRK